MPSFKSIVVATCCWLLTSAVAMGQATQPLSKTKNAPGARTTVSSGRYVLVSDRATAEEKLDDPWALSSDGGRLFLEEKWIVSKDSPERPPVEFQVEMTAGMQPTSATIGSGEGKIICTMALNTFSCARASKISKLTIRSPYYFFLPSPWMVAAAVRNTVKDPAKAMPIRLVVLGDVTSEGPQLHEMAAEVQYVGDDQITLSGRKVSTAVYELRPAGAPSITVWLMANGVPARMQDSERPEQRIELLDYVKTTHAQ